MAARRKSSRFRRRVLELSLVRISVPETCVGKESSRHVLSATLVWPRPMIAERISAERLVLENGDASFVGRAWADRAVFKETVQGTFGLSIAVSEHVSDGVAEHLLAGIGSSIHKIMETEAGLVAETPIGSRLLKLPFAYLGKLAAASDKPVVRTIAAGTIDMDSDKEVDAGKRFQIKIPMSVPETITEIRSRRRGGKVVVRRKTLLKVGEKNGEVVLSGRFYD